MQRWSKKSSLSTLAYFGLESTLASSVCTRLYVCLYVLVSGVMIAMYRSGQSEAEH